MASEPTPAIETSAPCRSQSLAAEPQIQSSAGACSQPFFRGSKPPAPPALLGRSKSVLQYHNRLGLYQVRRIRLPNHSTLQNRRMTHKRTLNQILNF